MSKPTIAIVGSGISGLFTAYFLCDKYQVSLFEQNNYFGGHSNTVNINYNNQQIAVDTGFIVFNKKTYPNFLQFLQLLQVDYQPSNMSFAVKINNKLEYAGTNISSIFAQKSNIVNFSFIKMLTEIVRFNKQALTLLNQNLDFNYSLQQFLDEHNFSQYFCQNYLLPMAAAIWSTDIDKIGSYPACSFARFFFNHGLLTVNQQPQWYTITGGSQNYVKQIIKKLTANNVKLYHDRVLAVTNHNQQCQLATANNQQIFDKIIIATHANQAKQILQQATVEQQNFLSAFSYQQNTAILHKDTTIMPSKKKAWASWVYSSNQNKQLSVTYWMNNLQNINQDLPLFVTLNPNQNIKDSDIFATINYQHPIFDAKALAMQQQIKKVQGQNNIYFCGAYQAYGFHEDGVLSALNLINQLNVYAPWQ
jgi:predicted NAD/FAD-binding protein